MVQQQPPHEHQCGVEFQTRTSNSHSAVETHWVLLGQFHILKLIYLICRAGLTIMNSWMSPG